jgi:hypothetical protein
MIKISTHCIRSSVSNSVLADPGGVSVEDVGLQSLNCQDRGSESR